MFCPESPRFLAKKDNWEGAEKVLVRLRQLPSDHPYVRNELSEIKEQAEILNAGHLTPKQMFKRLFQAGTRNRIGIGLILMCCQNMTGVNIIVYLQRDPNSLANFGIDILLSSYLRDTGNHRNEHEIVCYGVLRHRKDAWHDRFLPLAC